MTAGAADRLQTPEFRLAAACCRWPLTPDDTAAIRAAAAAVKHWGLFLRMVGRHRVSAQVDHALGFAGVALPLPVTAKLAARVQRIRSDNAFAISELARLAAAMGAERIPVLVLKGLPLARLAYDTLTFKQSRDIDLLVAPDRAESALRLLERLGYRLMLPAEKLNDAQRRIVFRYAKDVELAHGDAPLRVDLQWRLAQNPLLLPGIDTHSPSRIVQIDVALRVRTLAPDDLFAYLCVHGAHHEWSRLKWLVDLNALLAPNDEAELLRLYRYAQAKGAGLCAGQGLLLCHRLLQLKLPDVLLAELQSQRRLQKLSTIALRAMARRLDDAGAGVAGLAREIRGQFLLGQGLRYFVAQCRTLSVGTADAIRFPLPRPLRFLYPLLRLPLWLWRRAGQSSV